MFKLLIHRLKIKFGKKTKVALPHIIDGVTHVTNEALNNCWGSTSLQGQHKPYFKETH